MSNYRNLLDKFVRIEKNHSNLVNNILIIILTSGIALLVVVFSTLVFKIYGWGLFVGLPFIIGLLSTLLASTEKKQKFSYCIKISILTMITTACLLILLPIEGIICIIMALPPALILALAGTACGYWIQKITWDRYTKQTLTFLTIFIFPLVLGFESSLNLKPSLNEVQSSIVINAGKHIVWNKVLSSDLPEPDEFIFKTGIAYPIKAQIDGKGVGTVRYCIFSTGKFVEPIEVWDEPHLLKFSVTSSPSPMKELSIYSQIHPAHLDGFLKSKKGQFKLIEIDKNTTLLQGTTWYENKMWPESYWKLWSDYIIKKIHNRVLKHIKVSSES